jgi:16S rRNA (guanine(1405)-N(7))-methyltransferase
MADKTISDLEKLAAAVQSSSKYDQVDREFIKRLGKKELLKRRNLKEAVKAVKNKLHQVGGAYQTGQMGYQEILDDIQEAGCDTHTFLEVCLSAMRRHTSTRERLPYIKDFYASIFNELPEIHSLLDVACGLNPLARPWMRLNPSAYYLAVDIYQDLADFLNRYFNFCKIPGKAWASDVIESLPTDEVDLALLLKSIPCLEQIDSQAGEKLLDSLNSRFILISFPAHSLSGHDKGMTINYPHRFQSLAVSKSWKYQRFDFPGEIAFLIKK